MSKLFTALLLCAIVAACTLGVVCQAYADETGGRIPGRLHEAMIYDNQTAIIDGVIYEGCSIVYQQFENPFKNRWFAITQGLTAVEMGYGDLTRIVPAKPDIAYWHIKWETF